MRRFIAHTISQFFHYNPWVRGQRNHLLLALGRRLKGKGFSQAEFEQAAAFVATIMLKATALLARFGPKWGLDMATLSPWIWTQI